MNQRWSEVIESYTPQKEAWDRKYPYQRWVLRPISFPLTWLAAELGMSANFVTALTVLTAVAANWNFIQGNLVLGGIILSFTNLLDCVDGNLARMRSPTKAGPFYDWVASYPYFFSYACLGVGIGLSDPDRFDWWLTTRLDWSFSQLRFICLLGGFGILAIKLLNLLTGERFYAQLGADSEKARAKSGEEAVAGSFKARVYRNAMDLIGHDCLIAVMAALGAASLFLLGSLVLAAFDFLWTTFHYLKRAAQLQ